MPRANIIMKKGLPGNICTNLPAVEPMAAPVVEPMAAPATEENESEASELLPENDSRK